MTLSFSSLSGGTSFTVITSTGGSKTATLTKNFPAGTYLIESMAGDTNLEIYLGASDGTQVGSCVAGAKSVTASASFLYVTTVNANTDDAVTFTLKSAATLATKTDAVWSPPTITDITPSGLPNVNDTTTISGTNFATNVEVKFRKSDNSTLVTPKSTVRGSATSIIAGRPDSFAVGDAPYDVIVTNPSTNLSASSLNAITSGAVPVWVTSTTLNAATIDTAFSQTIQATDADGGSSITYAIVSGAFQTGLSFNTSTGAITGTPTGSAGSTTITISATDSGNNAVNRTFTQVINPDALTVDYIIVAGGGGGGAGGSGAGGLKTSIGGSAFLLSLNASYVVTVGSGGNGSSFSYGTPPLASSKGSNSSFNSVTATGGGRGGQAATPEAEGGNSAEYLSGGSGGGASYYSGVANYGLGIVGEGNDGGRELFNDPPYSSGGGGGAGAVGQNSQSASVSGNGGVGLYNVITNGAQVGQLSGGNYYLAGGGGGGIYGPAGSGTAGSGGLGGGGAGSIGSSSTTPGVNGSISTGGGCGGSSASSPGAQGGSGVVVLRYASVTQKASGGNRITTDGTYWYHVFTSSGTFNTTPSYVAKATGGTVTTDGSYWIHTFTGSGTFTPAQSLTADFLVVAGGGGGGTRRGGGGGAGGYRNFTSQSLTATAYTITVGAGGAGSTQSPARGAKGGNSSISGSSFTTVTSTGGGFGTDAAGSIDAGTGGSGGGAGGGMPAPNSVNNGGIGNEGGFSPVEGHNGGNATDANNRVSGGGGGSSAAGGNFSGTTSGSGGAGTSNSISGSAVTYAGGGGGGAWYTNTAGSGGAGGGGAGSVGGAKPTNGTVNLGGGGGGGGLPSVGTDPDGGSGGSGIVIIRYPV